MSADRKTQTEVPSHGVFPPFQKETFALQLAWLSVTFVLLYVLMAKVALPRVRAILEDRSRRIASDLDVAAGFKEQSDGASAACRKSLEDARARARSISEAKRQKELLAFEAGRSAIGRKLDLEIENAERRIALAKTGMVAKIRHAATDTASVIVERLTGTKPAETEIVAAISDVLEH